MKRQNLFFAFICILLGVLPSCTTTHEVLLGDVISFGDDAKTNYSYHKGLFKNCKPQGDPYVLYSQSNHSVDKKTKLQMIGRIKSSEMENNTAGIYAMDLGLDRIKYIRRHQLKRDPNARYYIIYMTDGLDNISCQVAKNNRQGNYKSPEKYKEKMKKKIAKVSRYKKKSQNPFDIYPVVFTGSDLGDVKRDNHLSDAEFDRYIENNMGWLRGSSRGPENAPKIIKGENFEKVLDTFKAEFNASGFEFHVPKGYAGKGIRMKFEDENHNQTELTGSFVKKGNKYYLRGIQLRDGLTSGVKLKKGQELELKAINNKDKKAELAIFSLEKPRYKNKPYFIVKDYVEQYVNDGGMWVKNSEYKSQSKGTIDTYFVLIFDASKSLLKYEKDEFGNYKRDEYGNLILIRPTGFDQEVETAIKMINVISQGVLDSEQKVDKIESGK